MAGVITTTTASESISTEHEAGQGAGAWLGSHVDDVEASQLPLGDSLSTWWPSAAGPQTLATERNPGESDAAFRDRHFRRVATAMLDNPPVP